MNFKEIGINKRNWVDWAQDMEPPGSINHGVSIGSTKTTAAHIIIKIRLTLINRILK